MAEIDDQKLLQLQQAEALLQRLYANKETKRDLERMAKKVNPSAVTTDEQLDPYLSDVKEGLKELKAFKKEIQDNMSGYSKEQQIQSLKKAGYTDEGIKAIEDIMEKKALKDYDVAAAYWDKVQPAKPVAPNGISPSMWNFENDLGDDAEDNALLMKNDEAWLDRKTAQIMNELKQKGDF